MKDLITAGYVYIAQPPLYRLAKGSKETYAWTEEERQRLLKQWGNGGVDIQRYKGLGEMNPVQLWSTTMDPARRVLKKVNLEDAATANEVFTILMGEAVEPRRQFIQQYAKSVKNLDV